MSKKEESVLTVREIITAITMSIVGIILCSILYKRIEITDIRKLLFYAIIFCVLTILVYVISFLLDLKEQKKLKKIKSGGLKYVPYTIDIKTFIEECKMDLLPSVIRINNNVYRIAVYMADAAAGDYDNFTCYIENKEIIGLDNFLNYRFDEGFCLNELDKIEFLEINDNDPKTYLVDRII